MMKLFNRFKKILIVEDDRQLRRALAVKLASEGFSVLEAVDGQEGLSMAMDEHPHLILLDLMLPKMDGMSVLEELRSKDNVWGKDVPVFIITNLGETDQRRLRAQELNVVEYIDKSLYQLDEIVKKVGAAL